MNDLRSRVGVSVALMILAATLATTSGACSSSDAAGSTSADASTGDDAGSGDDDGSAQSDGGDHGAVSTTYPAFTVDYPQIVANQGATLASPIIVTVSFAGDGNASTWEAFGDAIGASSYWSAATSEYGVGPAASGPTSHVRAPALPPTMSASDLQNLVAAAVQAAVSDAGAPDAGGDAGASGPAWPAPTFDANGDSQTIYSLFIPSSTTVTDPGTGTSFCTEGGLGYHDNVTVNGKPVSYSVDLGCGQTTAFIEETAAHEYVEAATNPYPSSNTEGYAGFDPNHLAWDLYTGFNDELADACQDWATSYEQESGNFPYWVQRSWSNKAATSGHDPCVPAPAGAYHGMTLFPSTESKITVDLSSVGGGKSQTLGFKAKVGQSVTFQVGFFSDADAQGPWTISYDVPASMNIQFQPLSNGTATVSIDKTSGQNGEKAYVTVTPKKAGAAGFQVMAITWDPPAGSSASRPKYLPVVISNQ